MSDELNTYPRKLTDYGVMIVELYVCPICNRYMVIAPSKYHGTFPARYDHDFDAQMKRVGWVKMSDVKQDDNNVCVECVRAGKATFLCVLCEQRKPTDKIQYSFGDPPEFACRDCYETVSAKRWTEAINALDNRHRYDHE